MQPTLVVLAAGLGSRYGGLKQIDPVGQSGETILDYSVFDAVRSGFGRVVFVIRREIEDAFRQAVLPRFSGRIEAAVAHQELDLLLAGCGVPAGRVKPWGTGHAILVCAPLVHGPFAVINADDFYGRPAYETLAGFFRGAPAGGIPAYAMVGFRLGRTLSDHGAVARALCRADEAGWLQEIREWTGIGKTPAGIGQCDAAGNFHAFSGDELVSMNMWGFTPAVFAQLEELFAAFFRERGGDPKAEFYIPSAVQTLIRLGLARVRVLAADSPWFGITYREDHPQVAARIRALVEAGEYPASLWG